MTQAQSGDVAGVVSIGAAQSLAAPLSPVQAAERVGSVDVVRGFALLGILAMNITAFALPSSAYMSASSPALETYIGPFTGGNKLVWHITHLLFAEKMMGIFSMLFGAGLILMDSRSTGGADPATSRRAGFAGVYYRRLAVLLGIGIIHAFCIWYGDILISYALCGTLLYPMRKLAPKWLITLAIAFLAIGTLLNMGMGGMLTWMETQSNAAQVKLDAGQTPTPEEKQMFDVWTGPQGPNAATRPEAINAEVDAHRGGFATSFMQNLKSAFFLVLFLFPMWMLWKGTGLMLLGMALMKMGYFKSSMPVRTIGIVMALGYLIGLPLCLLSGEDLMKSDFSMGRMFLVGGPLNWWGSVGVALGHLSLVLLLLRMNVLGWLGRSLAAVGRMAFTNYLMHSIVMTFIFYGWGLGMFAKFDRVELLGFVVGMWIFQLIISPLSFTRFQFGPAEWLWRTLTYGKIQPFLKPAAA
ncbi:MAG: DUF418 domain-containing protein [Planctomycetes bacterium]|nr:DUF418 domain-containing protein [Planctomycetota bacterium]